MTVKDIGECRCACHEPGGEDIMHCMACCTRCNKCGKNVKDGWNHHCNGLLDKVAKKHKKAK